MPLRLLPVLLALLLAALLPAAAAAASRDATRAELSRTMRLAGSGSSALVTDLATGERLYDSRSGTRRIPASVTKLYTTATALLALGPDATLPTEALGAAPVGADGTLAGDLHLRGSGDPTFGATQATALARQLVTRTGLRRIEGRVVGDERAFDLRRGPPSSGYRTSGYVGPLSALPYNRGLTGLRSPYFQVSPGLFTAQAFARALQAEGVRLGASARTGRTPAGATPLAAVASPPVAELVGRTNRPSDNYYAEILLKVLGARAGEGAPASTASGARVVASTMRGLGIGFRPADGSGLSRLNRTSPRQVVKLLRAMRAADPAVAAAFDASLPVAGRSGTLTGRMRGTAAAGSCRAKTGSLNGVSALAGICTAADGETPLAFAFLMNRVSLAGGRALQDRMAAALARYEP